MIKTIREIIELQRLARRIKRNGFANFREIKVPLNVPIESLIRKQEIIRSSSLKAIDKELTSAAQDESGDIISSLLHTGVNPNTTLNSAAYTNHSHLVSTLIEAGADVNHTTDEGLTPLMIACSRGSFESAKALIEADADVNVQDVGGRTAVHYAALSASSNIIQTLAETGANLDLCDENGIPAVHYASFVYEFETMDILTELGADPDLLIGTHDKDLILCLEVAKKNAKSVSHLLDEGANPNIEPLLSVAIHRENFHLVPELIEAGADVNKVARESTPLLLASFSGDNETVKSLITAGAEVNFQANDGKTALHFAASQGFSQPVKTLIEAGANIDHCDNQGITPLQTAALQGHQETMNILEESGANQKLQNIWGYAAYDVMRLEVMLRNAVIDGDVKTASELLQKGANPNFIPVDASKYDLLSVAIEIGNFDLVPLLLDAGIALDHQDGKGKSALMYAIQSGNEEVCLQVLAKSPDISQADEAGNTALHFATQYASERVVAEILAQKPDVNVSDSDGSTPLSLASLRGRLDVVDKLLEYGSDINILRKDLKSSLHLAAFSGHMNTVQLLVTAGLDPSLRDKDGFTPEDISHARGQYHVAWWLNKQTFSADRKENFRPELELSKETHDFFCRKFFDKYNDKLAHKVKGSLLQNSISVNAQNADGRTLLHEAAANGHVKVVKELLQSGALATALTSTFETPRDLAQQGNHNDVTDVLDNHINACVKSDTVIRSREIGDAKISLRNPLVKCYQYWDLLAHITKCGTMEGMYNDGYKENETGLSAIQKLSDLLSAGTPLVPPGSVDSYALHLAITSNCMILLPTLLAAGAPLVSSNSGLGIVQLAWRTLDITTLIGVAVTKAVEDRLVAEMKFEANDSLDRELKAGVENLVKQLQGKTPWLAKYPRKQGSKKMTKLLVRACSHGATVTAWWLRHAGGNTVFQDKTVGVTALQSALHNNHYRTASDLINHMGANPFLPDNSDQLLIDHFPPDLKENIIQGCLAKESTKLDRILERTLNGHITQQEEVMRLIQLLVVLFIYFTEHGENVCIENMQKFYAYSLKSGVTMLSLSRESTISDVGDGFWKLLDFHKRRYKDFTLIKSILRHDNEKEQDDFDQVLKDALKLCSERKFPLFLHLLVCVGKINVNDFVNQVCMTTALHHAAAMGNMTAVSYLISKGATLTLKDKFHCSPLHYAYMFGHRLTGDYLNSYDTDGNGRTNVDYWAAFNAYIRNNGIQEDLSAQVYSDSTSLTQHHLKKIRKQWKTKGISRAVRNVNVNFESGEAAEVKNAVVNSVKKLLSFVAAVNPKFEGELKQLGSSADGVRLYCPDEFDFNWIFRNMSGLQDGGLKVELKEFDEKTANETGYDRYVSVTACNDDLREWSKGSVLLPEFLKLIKTCLANFSFDDPRLSLVPPGVKHKMVGVGLTLRWSGCHYPLLLIDIDIVPTVQATRPKELRHPPILSQSVDRIYISTSLVDEWRLSSGILENHILTSLTKRQKEVFLACKMLISTLKVESWVPTEIKKQYRYFDNQMFRIPVPNGFILKNCFFKELEDVSDKREWQKDKLLDRIIGIFKRMCHPFQKDLGSEGSSYVPGQVYAYFGGAIFNTAASGEQIVSGATDKPYLGYGAPEILHFLEAYQSYSKKTTFERIKNMFGIFNRFRM